MRKLSLVSVRINELVDFVDQFKGQGVLDLGLPVCKRRLLSHANNPHADPTDIGLFLAYLDSACVGYMGMLAGLLRHQGSVSKVFFPSALYVPKEYRSTGAGQLLAGAAADLEADLVGCELREPAQRLWRKFDRTVERTLRIYRLPTSLVERSMAASPNRLEGIGSRSLSASRVAEIRWCSDLEVSELFRSPQTLSWTLQYPWLQGEDRNESIEENFYFDQPGVSIQSFPLQLYSQRGGADLGFQLLSCFSWDGGRAKTLKILDSRLPAGVDRRIVWSLAARLARELSASFIEASQGFVSLLDPFTLLEALPLGRDRTYFLRPFHSNSPLAKALPHLKFHFEDGDAAFTL